MAEAKIFESAEYVVTTERVVYGQNVFRLEDIKGGALPFIDRGYLGTAVIAGIGLLMLLFGGASFKFIGLLIVVGAYFFFTSTITRSVVVSLKSGEGVEIKVPSTQLAYDLSGAINEGIRGLHSARAHALRNELSSLPVASS